MAELNQGTTARMLEEIDKIISSAQTLIATLEEVGASTDELRETLAQSVEQNLLECYGAPTLARYIVRETLEE